MKKGITLLLTIALLLSAAFALSEETQTEQDAHIETYSMKKTIDFGRKLT